MLQRDDMVMMVMVVLVMMMILMKPSSMMATMAMISPSGKELFPGRFLPTGELSLSLCVFCPAEATEYFSDPPPVLGFWEDDIREGALAAVGQGSHTTWWCSQGWPTPGGGVGP
jgi:hypothetical protein